MATPIFNPNTKAYGIFQSDVIIRSAIMAALTHLRQNPWLLDYVFASLLKDPLTEQAYGAKEVANAKAWFLATDIPVIMDTRIGEPKLPAISIGLVESKETEATLADKHYDTQEDSPTSWPVLAGPFTPKYNMVSGEITLTDNVINQVGGILPGMFILDSEGHCHTILNVNGNVITINPLMADFTNAYIKDAKPIMVTDLESLNFRETYRIGCHVQGEPVLLTYLHSIVVFILLAYKEALLEARGFERSEISSGEFARNSNIDPENAYSRVLSITGYARSYWPKTAFMRIRGINPQLVVAPKDAENDDENNEEEMWLADQDSLTFGGNLL